MTEKPFEPSSVTKPIQLLAAWLVGLIFVNGSFLTAAGIIHSPSWAAGFLVICAALDVPIFLGALFLLQTKFRPEMQEDTYYAKYLERRSTDTLKTEIVRFDIKDSPEPKPIQSRLKKSSVDFRVVTGNVGTEVNDLLPNYKDVIKSLSKNGISVESTFGSSSKYPEIPSRRIVSFDLAADLKTVRKVISLMRPLGFDEVSLADEFYDEGRIYIGSYVYRDFPDKPKKLTDAMYDELMSDQLTSERVVELLT